MNRVVGSELGSPATPASPRPPSRLRTVVKVVGVILILLLLGGLAFTWPRLHAPGGSAPPSQAPAAAAKEDLQNSLQLVPGHPDTIRVPLEVVHQLPVHTALVEKAAYSRRLQLSGSLAPDTDFLLAIHPRFAGEVQEIGQAPVSDAGPVTRYRDLRTGDHVQKDELLAVVWSKDAGEKKNELIDALLKEKLDREILQRYERLHRSGALPERNFKDAEFALQADQNAIRKAEATLRSWRLNDAEIQAIHDEADRLAQRTSEGQPPPKPNWQDWARVEVRAPFAGEILEKNVSQGQMVDTSTNLFMLGDLSHLTVWAYVYEEDLPTLQALPRPIHWQIHLKAEPNAPPLRGVVSEIRPIIDPTVHAALVKGQVENPRGQLYSGQFIDAVIDLPAAPDEVVIPTAALVEDGQESVVWVQPDPDRPEYVLRHVSVIRRGLRQIHLRADVPPAEKRRGIEPLQAGERVVTDGSLVLWAALKDLQETAKAPDAPAK